ncbi:hypothetical protein LDENG_00094350 [Lucifuga dentata]|nr:hypothetical protein LDENG_00094350 [Lucifuga dentata]
MSLCTCFCATFVNELYGSSGLFPFLLAQIISDIHTISVSLCFLQIFCVQSYAGVEFFNLALMAYDRYVSICNPLLYHSVMTPAKVKLLLALVYFSLASATAVQVYLTSRLRLCEHAINKLLCDTMSLVNLSCEQSGLISVYGLCCAVCAIVVPFILVILSYVHIFAVIAKTSKESRMKALQTCAPHLLTFINFSAASFFGVVYNRLGLDVPRTVNVFTSLNFFVIPPLLHPIIYGIKMQEIRRSINRMMRKKMMQ